MYDDFSCGLMYFHTGAGILGTADSEATAVDRFTVETGCTIFNVDYRRAPENPAPAGF
jgi:acetyl esterase